MNKLIYLQYVSTLCLALLINVLDPIAQFAHTDKSLRFFSDIDECAEPGARVTPCKNARCVNTAGSYKCYCKHGFMPTRRANICVRRRTR